MRGVCGSCGRVVRLRANGSLGRHQPSKRSGLTGGFCPATGGQIDLGPRMDVLLDADRVAEQLRGRRFIESDERIWAATAVERLATYARKLEQQIVEYQIQHPSQEGAHGEKEGQREGA